MLVDLSHTIEHGMMTYPGLPGPLICDYLSREASRAKYAPGVEFQIGKIDMVANTGTYLDSPFHRYADGNDLAALPLERLAGLDAVVVRIGPDAPRAIGWAAFERLDVRGRAVLVSTGWDRHWRTERYGQDNPFLTADACGRLRDAGAQLVGIDSVNIDDLDDTARPAHSILLGAEIPIVEHLCNLGALPVTGLRFSAVPPKVVGFGTFPVRAFVEV
ncbi:MAG TPA: cyclase family protein [Gemmatimonadales bacterium]|nr:cyclase family protein [Gemmatimonadales bacterium]